MYKHRAEKLKRVLRERDLCLRLLKRREFKKFQAEPRCCDRSRLPDNGDFLEGFDLSESILNVSVKKLILPNCS